MTQLISDDAGRHPGRRRGQEDPKQVERFSNRNGSAPALGLSPLTYYQHASSRGTVLGLRFSS
jgi:hypothetical protein